MAIVLQHKVVAALPSPLEPDSIYYVRVGQGFDIHVTNGLGEVVAYGLNAQIEVEALPDWSTAETASAALTALGMSASGKAVATGTPAQGRAALALGTAATANVTTSDTDTTTGRVMRVGDGGLLGSAIQVTLADINSRRSGFYYISSTHDNPDPDVPAGAVNPICIHSQVGTSF